MDQRDSWSWGTSPGDYIGSGPSQNVYHFLVHHVHFNDKAEDLFGTIHMYFASFVSDVALYIGQSTYK